MSNTEDVLVTVVMSTYKEKLEFINSSIASILEQSYKNIEFIIVLDNPENKEIESVLDYYVRNDNRVRVLKNEKNIGLVKSLNRALKEARGEYIVRMDADDISDNQRIEKQLRYVIKHNIDILGGGIEVIDEKNKVIKPFTSQINGVNTIKKVFLLGNPIPHPTWIVKKEVYDRLSGYNEVPTAEDYDFLLRALREDYIIDNLNECILQYRFTENSISRTNSLKQFLIRKELQKNYKYNRPQSVIKNYDYITLKMEKRYSKAEKSILRGSARIGSKDIGGIIDIIRAIFLSYYSIPTIMDIICVKKYSRKMTK